MPFEKGVCPNPAGRKGGKEKDPTPPELRRLLGKLKNIQPEAVDVLIENMVKTLPDGTVLKDTKIAEKLIGLYFQALKASEDIKARNKKENGELSNAPQEPSRPKFTLEVVNPSTGAKVGVATQGS